MGAPSVRNPQRRAIRHRTGVRLMGASNALAAFRRWAGKVPGGSLTLLAYMALVSKDKDDWPWYGQGQEALAEFALGRENPDRSDLRAVSRAMQPLLDEGAVTVDRAAAGRTDGNTTARYRLNLTDRADEERRKWESTHDGKRRTSKRVEDPQRTTKNGRDVRRKPTRRTTESGTTYDGNRRTKEEEDQEERENRGIAVDLTTTSHPLRATEPSEPAPVIPLFPGTANAPDEPPYRSPPVISRWRNRPDPTTEASARRRKAEAEYQARLAEETS
jgi:hypothetical protein